MIHDIVRPIEADLTQYMTSQNNLSSSQAAEAISLAQDTIMHSFRRQIMHNRAEGLLGLFDNQVETMPHALETEIRDEYTDQLATQMNLPAGTAIQVARYTIPAIVDAMRRYVTVGGEVDRERLLDVIAGDFGTLRESLEKGRNAEHGRILKDRLSEIFGFGIGGKGMG